MRKGSSPTVDVLGEEIATADEARAIAGQYHDVLARLDEEKLDANISIKLTALGLELDLDLCRENVEAVVVDAAARGRFVRIDMEDSSTTDRTLALHRELRDEGHEQRGRRAPGVPAANARRRSRARQRPDLQGDLRRAARARLRRVRGRPRELRPVSRDARRAGNVCRDRDPRRVPDRRGAAHRRRGGVAARPVRVPDAARRAPGPGRRARRGRAQAARVRPVRRPTGTSTPCAACRRTRRSRGTWHAISRRVRCCAARAPAVPRATTGRGRAPSRSRRRRTESSRRC